MADRKSTPRLGHAPITMRLAKDDFNDIDNLGDYFINEAGDHIAMAHPSPMGAGWTFVHLPIYKEGEPKPAKVAWTWDGNRDAPTLAPSIDTHGHWHGFVRAGKMVEA